MALPGFKRRVDQEALDATCALLERLALSEVPIEEQAAQLEVTVDRLHSLRAIARRRGYDLPKLKPGGPGENNLSAAWHKVDSVTERCKCGLLLPCNSCIPTIYELAGSRRGPGRVLPEGGPGGCREAKGYVQGQGMVRLQQRSNRMVFGKR